MPTYKNNGSKTVSIKSKNISFAAGETKELDFYLPPKEINSDTYTLASPMDDITMTSETPYPSSSIILCTTINGAATIDVPYIPESFYHVSIIGEGGVIGVSGMDASKFYGCASYTPFNITFSWFAAPKIKITSINGAFKGVLTITV